MLPKSSYPLFSIRIPSLNRDGKFRQWLTREEKLLLVAKESDSVADKMRAVYQVVNNCSVDVKPDQMTSYDMEWVFLKIREMSVSPTLDLSYTDPEDNQDYRVQVPLSQVEMPTSERNPTQIFTAADVKFEIKDIQANLFLDDELITKHDFDVDEVLVRSLVAVWDAVGKKFSDFSLHDAREFLLDIDPNVLGEARKFILEAPSMNFEVKYSTKKGTERSIKLTSLTDFFTL